MPETVSDIFTVGGTVQAGRGLYLPRHADTELHALCRNGTFAYVLTPRQLGKSSLMVRTASQLAEEDIRSVMIDLTQIGVQVTADTWYLGLLAATEDQLGLESDVITWWRDHAHLGVTQRLTLFFQEVLLAEVAEPIVIFIDEIDTTLSLSFTDDFYAAIRFFANARAYVPEFNRLSFVLIGVATPGDLIRDPQRTPFNIGQRVDLTDFTFEEALPLAEGFGLTPADAQRVLRRVLWWTGGHPYLTQRLCRALVLQHRPTWSDADVDELVAATFLGHVSEQDNNLQFVRDMLTKRAPNLTAVLTTYQQVRLAHPPVVDEEQSLIKSHLKLSGVIARSNTTLQVRNRIYNEVFDDRWIKEHLPVNWLRRARQAGIFLAAGLVVVAGLFAWRTVAEARRDLASAEQVRQSAIDNSNRSAAASWEALTRARDESARAITDRHLAKKALEEAEKKRRQAEEERANTLAQLAGAVAENDQALVNRLAGESEATPLSPKKLLLALEAVKRSQRPSLEVDRALRRGLSEWSRVLTPPNKFAGIAHTDRVMNIAFSRTGQYLATSGSDHSVSVWEVNNTKTAVATMPHGAAVTGMSFSPLGRYLATASSSTVSLWELASGKLVRDTKHDVDVTSLAFSPDGRYLASTGGQFARIWEAVTGREIARMTHAGGVSSVTFSPDGQFVATAGVDGMASVWSISSGRSVAQKKHGDSVAVVAFSPTGTLLASADTRGTVLVWRPVSGAAVESVRHDGAITALAFSPDGQYLASASRGGTVRVAGVAGGVQGAHIRLNGAVNAVVFSQDSRLLVTGGSDGTARLWAPATGKQLAQMDFPGEVTALAFHPATPAADRRLLAIAANYRTSDGSSESAHVWEVLGGSEVAKIEHGRRIVSVAFAPEGDHLAAAGEDGKVQVWSTSGTQVAKPFTHEGVFAVTISNGASVLAAASSNRVTVWNVSGGKQLLNQPFDHVQAIALTSDGQHLAVSDQDNRNTAQIWDITTRSLQAEPRHEGAVRALSFSPRERYLATAGDKGVTVWDFNGRLVRRMAYDAGVQAVKFSEDGRYLATANRDGTARLWALATAQQVGASVEHSVEVKEVAFSAPRDPKGPARLSTLTLDNVVSVRDVRTGDVIVQTTYERGARHTAFSPDGRYVAAAGSSEGVRVWPWRQDLLIPLACSRLATNLTWSEWRTHLHDEPYRKTCPELPINSASFVEGARARARAGDLAGATAILREARKYDSSLTLDPDAEARRELAQFRIQQGETRARMGDVDGAIGRFKEALAMNPSLRLDAEPRARELAASGKIQRALVYAREGRIRDALALFEEAQRLTPKAPVDANSWNTVCWFGALLSDASAVLPACERAVEMAPTNGNFRDSRGVARAISGKDIPGAIADFQAYIDSAMSPDRKKERQGWIDALRAGTNPAEIFTAPERKRLTVQ